MARAKALPDGQARRMIKRYSGDGVVDNTFVLIELSTTPSPRHLYPGKIFAGDATAVGAAGKAAVNASNKSCQQPRPRDTQPTCM